MNNLFLRTSAHWVRYSEYQYKQTEDGRLYVTPAPTAKPAVYDPLQEAEAMVLDALNVGRLCMKQDRDAEIRVAVMDFVSRYGLLGFLTALPTTPAFIDYNAVYLPTNHFIREETLSTEDYLAHFFPFTKLDFSKKGKASMWNLSGDRTMIALSMTFEHQPQAQIMGFQREYAEPFDWLVIQFKDLAFTFLSSYLYYEDYDHIDEATRNLYRQGMAAFSGMAPTYHIELLDRPTIVWEFHSLLLGVQLMLSFALTDENSTLRLCKHCDKVFAASRPNAAFCSAKCKNQYNVYKGRENADEED